MKYPCLICEEDHYTKDCPRRSKVKCLLKWTPNVLKEPFPSEQTQLVDQPRSSTFLGSQFFMMQGSFPISISTQTKYYQTMHKQTVEKEASNIASTSTPSSFGLLHIECPNNEFMIQPPHKGVIWKSSFNLNVRVAQHYNIVRDLTQEPSTMFSLQVLQSYPMQWKSLLHVIGVIDPSDSSLITFDLENHVPRLPHQITFLLQVLVKGNTIHQTVIDEGASTYIMSVSCWNTNNSPTLNQSPNTLEAFDVRGSRPYGILTNLSITLEWKTLELEVEGVDANLNYNLLLR